MRLFILVPLFFGLGLAMPKHGDDGKSTKSEKSEDHPKTTTSYTSIPTPTTYDDDFATSVCYPTATSYYTTTSKWYENSCTVVEKTKTITTYVEIGTKCESTKTRSPEPSQTCDDHGDDGKCS
ncbi:hypothetical protein BCR34DRAFT_586109 [Clohesyomyces aquaticus]|uniref:Uncharacterized protein n=1 Tax=Clohesyomyces aquaticus TaxID=1231657 RepID=A0A1Y1ZV06_9PLEO|nr:hypothetical protein BCR34DRAFT_586109 [Clohesyomyces aquaticus]